MINSLRESSVSKLMAPANSKPADDLLAEVAKGINAEADFALKIAKMNFDLKQADEKQQLIDKFI